MIFQTDTSQFAATTALKPFRLCLSESLTALLATIIAAAFMLSPQTAWAKSGKTIATEYPAPDEAAVIADMVGALKRRLEKDYPDGERTKRDAHPKQHGLVRAEFTVMPDIPETLKIGVFADPKTYDAYVRYSNAFPGQPDIKKDSRGMAIKLMGVPGDKLLPELKTATTQDFVLMNTHFFVTKDARGFSKLLKAAEGGGFKSALFFITHPNIARRFFKVRERHADLQGADWGSVVPYLLGEGQAVKYRVAPQIPSTAALPDKKTARPDYLRERLAADLARQDYVVDFYIQVQIDANKMPIEDASVTWDPKASPFIKVAEIKLLKQTFDTPEQQLYGDQLCFSPWHALPEHRPLGSINRARKVIYETMSKFRHERNGEVSEEPTEWREF